MKVILYMAVSVDGYVAKSDGNSDWVAEADIPEFEGKIKSAECIVIGRRTFDQFYPKLYPVKNVLNIVLTKDQERLGEKGNVLFTNKMPGEIIEIAKSRGYKQILIIGGGHLNASFLKDNLIDEIYLDVHPLILGKGIKLFEEIEKHVKLKLQDVKKLKEGLILLHYQVEK